MTFSVEHPDQTAPITFEDRSELLTWARGEMSFWSSLKISGLRTPDQYVRTAQTNLQRLVDSAKDENASDADILQKLRSVAPTFYLSTGPKGQLLESLRSLGHEPQTLTAALAALLKAHDEVKNSMQHAHWTYNCAIALAHVAVFEASGDPNLLVSLYRAIEEYKDEWATELTRLRTQIAENQSAHTTEVETLRKSVSEAQTRMSETTATYEGEIQKIRTKFEEQFALRTPMTYWTEKAERHTRAARLYRNWFSGLLGGGTIALAVIGYYALFPFLGTHPTAYWALILFSVLIALLAWPLRMTSKQYLVHQQLYEDASERAVIAKTFLALGEQVKLTDADRQILLGSLMRPASVSLVSDDSGLNITDLIMAKTFTKS